MPDPIKDYQVQEQDKDLLTLAANLNVDYNKLKEANPFTKSISPGQFINVPTNTDALTAKQRFSQTGTGTFFSGGRFNTVSPGVAPKGFVSTVPKTSNAPKTGVYVPPTNAAAQNWLKQQQQAAALNPAIYQGPSSFTSAGGKPPTAELQLNINQQVASGMLPPIVPTGTSIINPQTGNPVTQQEMLANGYVYNNFTKGWELNGTGQPPATQTTANGEQQPTPAYLQIVNYNGTAMPAWEAELRAKRAAKKNAARKRAALAAQQQVRDDTAATTLNLRLGS